ncbi:YicC/YloC family endoribonuclease [Psychroflexus planctonicus]|uniref:YicC family protein n=1 Tax=Psychroflexus planctonicus TaxID=1526575 RepID=A0ABQ1SHB5_9FLAO|nr:YicC/YloC family endoribonuclease [Psychroflexus planctonicus]GGE34466.1 hypothetical protein GCM10010832_13330 [Psychroflexus planctonicus]
MIHSMTGFGKSTVQLPNKKISVEIKSLNSKNLDINTRMPSQYREKELEMRKMIAAKVGRGKVDFTLQVEITGDETSAKINHEIVKAYMYELRDLANISNAENAKLLEIALSLPDAVSTEVTEVDEAEFKAIQNTIQEALENLNAYRKDEGLAMEKDFKHRIENLQQLLEEVIQIDPERIQNLRAKLEAAIEDLKTKVDEDRFEQELVFYIEKYDITEEKVRLANHLSYFIETITAAESSGKKLGFISQEMGREINTIGSKSNSANMQKLVVQMKDELEKIKEQMLNVL